MNAIRFESFGEPANVLAVRDIPTPEPGPGEVRVRMIASPVNPSDLLVARGLYTFRPALPATPGFEGVGVVDKAGRGVLGRIVKGKRVVVINGAGGNWAEYAVIPARQARPVPSFITDDQAAVFFVNPMTVLALVRHVLRVPRGEWLLQSAAGSELGKMIIRLCRHDGIKTLNVVRRPEAVAELEQLGGDRVVCSASGPIPELVREVVPNGVRYALDCVGGETGAGVFESLGVEGRMVVYGTLTNQPIPIDSRRMIAGKRRISGFWLGHWMRERSIPKSLLLFREVAGLVRAGVLSSEIGRTFRLSEITEAATEAERVARRGKVLLKMG